MRFARVTNQILLGAVAFTISFCISLVVNRDIKQAAIAGLFTVPATYISMLIIHTRRINQDKWLLNSLQDEIQTLEQYKTDLDQYLSEAIAEEQDIEASIKALQAELYHLRTQVSEGYNQRREQNRELLSLQTKKQQQETHLSALQNQIINFENQLEELTQEIKQLELTKHTATRQVESHIHSLNQEHNTLKLQVTQKDNERKAVEQDLIRLKKQNHQLIEERQTLKSELHSLQVELGKIQDKIIEKQNEQIAVEQGLLYFDEQRRQLIAGLNNLQIQMVDSPEAGSPQLPDLPDGESRE